MILCNVVRIPADASDRASLSVLEIASSLSTADDVIALHRDQGDAAAARSVFSQFLRLSACHLPGPSRVELAEEVDETGTRDCA